MAMSLTLVALFGYIIWGFDYFDELHVQTTMTAAVALHPLLITLDIRKIEGAFRRFDWLTLGGVFLSSAFLMVALGDRWESTFLVIAGGSLVAAVTPLIVYVITIGKNRFLIAAVIPTVLAGLTYGYLQVEISAELVSVLIPFVLFAGIPWILALRLSWECARRTQRRPLIGPFMESLTMFFVAVPLVAFAVLSVQLVTDEQTWMALAGIFASFVFGSAVSTPFRQFLRALGGFEEQHGERR
ncbi:hypothetical protein F4Y93_11825 [Candidatus Poribacteria bacterium]|nr:hypothetical protein [Candidatus Poribacteria bacterium]